MPGWLKSVKPLILAQVMIVGSWDRAPCLSILDSVLIGKAASPFPSALTPAPTPIMHTGELSLK